MRAVGDRKKKLIVAFHFQRSGEAGWKCDACRQAGLERARRCGFLQDSEVGPVRIVWARRQASTDRCPKSEIMPDSAGWLERFFVWRRMGMPCPEELSARDVEAFVILQEELVKEGRDG